MWFYAIIVDYSQCYGDRLRLEEKTDISSYTVEVTKHLGVLHFNRWMLRGLCGMLRESSCLVPP